jgi:hypothetical protein
MESCRPAASCQRRRRSRVPAGSRRCSLERARRGEHDSGGAATYLSPEPARRRGCAAVLTDVQRNSDRRRARNSYGVLTMQELTVVTQEASARAEVVGIARISCSRRRECQACCGRYGELGLDSFCKVSESRVVTTVVTTPWLGRAPVISGRRWPEMLGFRFGGKFNREKGKRRLGFRPGIYTAPTVVDGRPGQQWWPGRGALVGVVSTSCACRGRGDEDEDASSCLSGTNR